MSATPTTTPAAASTAVPSQPDAEPRRADGESVSLLIATVPAIFAYFVGWAYLHYYLDQFGIGVAELELGIESIFIYSVPPIVWMFKAYWWLLAVALVAAVFSTTHSHLVPTSIRSMLSWSASSKSLMARGITIFGFLVILVLLLSPAIREAAVERAQEKWASRGPPIQTAANKPSDEWTPFKDFQACQKRRAMDLILADNDGYFMLCVSEINDNLGSVYEVRRGDSVLASVRAVQRRLSN